MKKTSMIPVDIVKRAYAGLSTVVNELRRHDELVYCVSEGNLPNQGGRLVVHYLGRKRFANDFLMFYDRNVVDAAVNQNIAYSGSYLRFFQERKKAVRCPSGADVLFVDRIFTAPGNSGSVVLAPHINAVLPVQPSVDAQLQLIRSKGHRRKLQSALKHGFSWRKTHSIADFNLYYDVMYAPFVRDRFGHTASMVPREDMKRVFLRRGFLLFVEENGIPISGAMMYTSRNHRDALFYWKYGLANSTELTPAVFGERNAMTEAMVLQYAVNEKFREIEFGLTKAMPWDGIFTHKKRLGCDFRQVPGSPEFNLLINPASKTRLLSRFPLVVTQNDTLQSWVAQEGEINAKNVEDFKENLRACTFASSQATQLFTHGINGSADLLTRAVQDVQADTHSVINVQSID